MKKSYTLVLSIMLALTVSVCNSQILTGLNSEMTFLDNKNPKIHITDTPENVKKIIECFNPETRGVIYDTSRWRTLVDEIWGEGPSTKEKLRMFDHFWDTLNTGYASFVNLDPLDWDNFIVEMRKEIANEVSRGRFLGLMTHLVYKINDAHTGFVDRKMRFQEIYHGLPMVANYAKNYFPATLTALEDTTALVLNPYPNNPFSLEQGDIIMGYNGRPLSYLINEVLYHKLPIIMTFGSTNAATIHNLTIAVASSWNLFDTIDIKKTDGSIVHLPVNRMLGMKYWNDGYEIMQIKGIIQPHLFEVYEGDPISSCVLAGTEIGYVSYFSCLDRSGDSLYNHVKYLVEEKKVNGLIIDLRNNIGGIFSAFSKTIEYLADKDLLNWFNCANRGSAYDRLSMSVVPYYAQAYNIYDTDPNYFDGKIALLVGPNAMSAGDVMPVTFKELPNVKLFGKSTAGAFGACIGISKFMHEDYGAYMQTGNFILVKEPDKFLSHLEFPVDTEVWFTPEKVKNGIDDVLESALLWMDIPSDVEEKSSGRQYLTVYPNPSENFIKINSDLIKYDDKVEIFNNLGELILAESYKNGLNISGLYPGTYFIRVNYHTLMFTKIQ